MYFKKPSDESDRIHFNVKTKAAAVVCLSTVTNIKQPFIEFAIEFTTDGLSELRLRNGDDFVVNKNVFRENLLSESEFKGFWIDFSKGVSKNKICIKTKVSLHFLFHSELLIWL